MNIPDMKPSHCTDADTSDLGKANATNLEQFFLLEFQNLIIGKEFYMFFSSYNIRIIHTNEL